MKYTFQIEANKTPYSIPKPNNIGVVRYILAFQVLIAHFNLLDDGNIYNLLSSFSGVGGFFTLSGFLVYGSYLKLRKPGRYFIQRAFRILPAYWATVLIFAIGLALISTLSPAEYFLSPQFWKYILANIFFLNYLEPNLPGVFSDFAVTAVNVSLWTMKVEWMLYFSVPLVDWLIRKLKFRPIVMFSLLYIFSAIYRIVFLYLYETSGNELYEILGRQFAGQLMYFYTGVIIYYYFNAFMRLKWPVLIVSVLLLAIGLTIRSYLFFAIHPMAFGSLVILFSMVGKWGTFEGRRDNISYNIYLLHAPIFQIAAYFGLTNLLGMWGGFIISLITVILLSAFINVAVEKPIRRLRKQRFAVSYDARPLTNPYGDKTTDSQISIT